MRRLVVGVLVLLALLAAADRVAAVVVARIVAARVQTAAGLPSRPSVSFQGFPFLTQALAGRFQQVDVTASDLTVAGLTFTTVTARLDGVHVSLSQALHGNLRQVEVDRGSGQAVLGYAALSAVPAYRDRGVSVAPAGADLRISGRVQVLGASVPVSVLATVTVSDGVLVVAPATGGLAGSLLALRVNTSGLPFGVRLTSVAVTPTGLVFAAAARGLVVPT